MGFKQLGQNAREAVEPIREVASATKRLGESLGEINNGPGSTRPLQSISSGSGPGGSTGSSTTSGGAIEANSLRASRQTNRLLSELVDQGRRNLSSGGGGGAGSSLSRRASGV